MKKTTLSQMLNKIPVGTPIKVGCRCGWFYCYYMDKETKQRITEESEKTLANYKRYLSNKKSEYSTLERRFSNNMAGIKKSKNKTPAQKKKELDELKEKYVKEKEYLPKVIDKLEKKVNTLVPFLQREVKTTYQLNMPTYENPKTIYIVIQGKVLGDYGDIDEYAYKNDLPIKKEDDKWGKILRHRHYKKERKVI